MYNSCIIESKRYGLTVSLDISKAVDHVWHRALVTKLRAYELGENLCRSIKVDVHCFHSEDIAERLASSKAISCLLLCFFYISMTWLHKINKVHFFIICSLPTIVLDSYLTKTLHTFSRSSTKFVLTIL